MLTLFENNPYDGYTSYVGGVIKCAQSFMSEIPHKITLVKLVLYAPSTWLHADGFLSVYATDANHKPTGVPLANGTIHATDLVDNTFTVVAIDLGTGYPLMAETQYAFVVSFPGSDPYPDTSKMVRYHMSAGHEYQHGNLIVSMDSGSTWTIYDGYAFTFEEWGYPQPAAPKYLGDIHIDQLIYQHAERMEV